MSERHGRNASADRPDPAALSARAASCWDQALRGYSLSPAQKSALAREGLAAADLALAAAPDHREALTYKSLLLRLQVSLEKDPDKRTGLLAEADQLRDKAVRLQKQSLAFDER